MKTYSLSLLIIFLIVSCSQKKQENTVIRDSTSLITDSVSLSEKPSVFMNCKFIKADTGSLPEIVQSFIDEEESRKHLYYTLDLLAEGYEYRSQTTWYYDSAFNLRYVVEDWVSEALSGNNQYVFCNDKIHALYEITSYDGGVQDVIQAYRNIGAKFTHDEAADIRGEKSLLDIQYTEEKKTELIKKLTETLRLLEENESRVDDSSIVLHLAKEVEYGPDFTATETVDITLEKILLEKLNQ